MATNQAGSDDASTRRDSGSSTSSITVPGSASPPLPSARQLHNIQTTSSSSVHRRGSAPALREGGQPGLGTAFASPTPNFLSPTTTMPGSYLPRSNRASRNSSTSSVPDIDDRPRPAGPRGPSASRTPSVGTIYARMPNTAMASGSGGGTTSWIRNGSGAGSTSEMRRASELSSSSPLRWVADMVGWHPGQEEEGPRGERR